MDIETLAENFELLGPWEERYRYLIDLGRQLEAMPEADKTEQTRVRGCMSQVWLTHEVTDEQPPRFHFRGDSDAHIVKGLIALLFMAYSGKTAEQIRETDIKALFGRLGLESHLSMNRRNGFYAMVERIRSLAGAREPT